MEKKKKTITLCTIFLLTILSLLWALQPKTIDCLEAEGWVAYENAYPIVLMGAQVSAFKSKDGRIIFNPTCHIVDWGN